MAGPPASARLRGPFSNLSRLVFVLRTQLIRWRTTELAAQLGLGGFQYAFLRCRKVLAGAIDVKVQHRHRRLERAGFAAVAVLSRALQRSGDPLGTARLENVLFEIERVAGFGDLGGPFAVGLLPCHRFSSAYRRELPPRRCVPCGDAKSPPPDQAQPRGRSLRAAAGGPLASRRSRGAARFAPQPELR